ncbi:MAG: glycosyltransferase family 2 protein [Sphingomonas bacterium]
MTLEQTFSDPPTGASLASVSSASRCDRPRGPLGLRLAVQLQAFTAAPAKWLEAAWWRLVGKRLRSRWLFSPLLGSAPVAYRLWLSRNETEGSCSPVASPPIVALVDDSAEAGEEALAATLHSLALENLPALVGTPAEAAARIDWAASPWLLPLAAGDTLAPGAARAYRMAIAKRATRIAYADDDRIDAANRRSAPHFKPDWNVELQGHCDMLSGASILQPTRAELERVGAVREWPRRLAELLAAEAPPIHVRKVLHHRRTRPLPQFPAALVPGILPPISIIIPTRNRADLLRTCFAGLAATTYPDREILVVDNDSDDPETLALLGSLDPKIARVLRHPGGFNFSAINNRAAAEAKGRLLCLLNNDVEMIESTWLNTLVTQALRPEVGAVGARLLYPDGRIQHAGVLLGLGGGTGHAHRLLRPDDEGYFRRHALPQYVSAVTAACLVVSREKYLAVGGLDEREFPVAFNDVDLCMKLNTRGWQTLYEPRATLVHHESISRGLDRDAAGARRLAGELAALKRKWVPEGMVDPFHHPALSRFSETFVVDL